MAAKAIFDVTNRLITLTEAPVDGVVTIDLRVELYSDGKEDWVLNTNDERSHRFPFITAQSAGQETTGGREEPIFFRMRNGSEGWRILPFDADHDLTILGTIVPTDPTQSIVQARPGRTILVFQDGSEVAQLTQGNTLSVAQNATLELLKYQDQKVFVNTELIAVGDGSARTPFNDVGAALDFAEAENIRQLVVLADMTLDRNLKNFRVQGLGLSSIDLNGNDTGGTIFDEVRLRGAQTGTSFFTVLTGGLEDGVTGVIGGLIDVNITGEVEFLPFGLTLITNLATARIDVPPALLMPAGGLHRASIQHASGDLVLKNFTLPGHEMRITIIGGALTIDASCTGGEIYVSGAAEVIDNSAGTLVDLSANAPPVIPRESWTRLGLNPDDAFTDTPSQFSSQSGDIDIAITGDGETTTTQTRQP